MAEISARFYDVAALDQRPIVAIFVSRLDFAQWMTKRVLAQAFKVVTRAAKVWRTEVDGIRGSARDAELLRNIGRAGEWAYAAPARANIIYLGLVDHIGRNRPRVMKAQGHSFHGLREVSHGNHVVVDRVFARPGIPSPQIHVGLQNVVKPPRNLVVIRRSPYYGAVVVHQALPVGSGDIRRRQERLRRAVPALLRNHVARPRYVRSRIGVETSSGERIAGTKRRGTSGIRGMRHVNGYAIIGKIAILDVGHWHRCQFKAAGAIAQSFVSAEVEQFVGDDFSAGSASELVAFERRLGAIWDPRVDVREEIFRVKRIIPQEVVRGSMKFVGAALGNRVDLRRTATVLRCV